MRKPKKRPASRRVASEVASRRLTVRYTESEYARLEKLARKDGVTVSEVVRRMTNDRQLRLVSK